MCVRPANNDSGEFEHWMCRFAGTMTKIFPRAIPHKITVRPSINVRKLNLDDQYYWKILLEATYD